MGEAAAENPAKGCGDFLVRGVGFVVQNCFGGHDDATQAEPALGSPFVDKSLLQRMRLLGCPEALQGDDLVLANRADRHHA